MNYELLIEGIFVYLYGFDFDYFLVCFVMKKKFDRLKNSLRLVFCYDKVDFDGL